MSESTTRRPAAKIAGFVVALIAAASAGAAATYFLTGADGSPADGHDGESLAAESMPDLRAGLTEDCFAQSLDEAWCLDVADVTATRFEENCSATAAETVRFAHLRFVVAVDDNNSDTFGFSDREVIDDRVLAERSGGEGELDRLRTRSTARSWPRSRRSSPRPVGRSHEPLR